MKETVLLYNFTDKKRALMVRQALLPLGIRLKPVQREEYLKPIGALVSPGTAKDSQDKPYDGPGFTDEMLLMAGFTSGRIDTLIQALRRWGVGKIDYKAVLTDTNRDWDSLKLYEEIRKEHEAMSQ